MYFFDQNFIKTLTLIIIYDKTTAISKQIHDHFTKWILSK